MKSKLFCFLYCTGLFIWEEYELLSIVDGLQVIELPLGFTLVLPFLVLPLLLVISSPISDNKGSASSLLKKVELTATAQPHDLDRNPGLNVDFL